MSTPFERLTAIINSYTPAVVKFKLNRTAYTSSHLSFDSFIVKESQSIPPPDDKELFELMKDYLNATWGSGNTERYVMTTTVDSLWHHIARFVTGQYDRCGVRCTATKRKTMTFIDKIKVDDKMLAGFLLQTFIKLQSSVYKNMSTKDRGALFEQFDSLRRTFGKRI